MKGEAVIGRLSALISTGWLQPGVHPAVFGFRRRAGPMAAPRIWLPIVLIAVLAMVSWLPVPRRSRAGQRVAARGAPPRPPDRVHIESHLISHDGFHFQALTKASECRSSDVTPRVDLGPTTHTCRESRLIVPRHAAAPHRHRVESGWGDAS